MEHDAIKCDGCIWHSRWCKEMTTMGLTPYDFERYWEKGMKEWKSRCPMWKKNTTHKGNGTPTGIFAGTLTMSPDDKLNEEDMVHAMKKIVSQQTCPVKNYAWYVEYTDNGLPHIHFIYEAESGGRIHQKVFKRYWKQWDESKKMGQGHRGGYHKHVQSETAYLEYIEKDGGRHMNQWTT